MSNQSEEAELSAVGKDSSEVDTKLFYCPLLLHYGSCSESTGCRFSHSQSAFKIPKQYCKYFLENHQRQQESCSTSATWPANQLEKQAPPSPSAPGPARESCSDETPIHEQRVDFLLRHNTICRAFELDNYFTWEMYNVSKDKMCAICLEKIVDKKPYQSSLFGLLENCDHAFCLGCIKQWTESANDENNKCPVCRADSKLVLVSNTWFKNRSMKEDWFARKRASTVSHRPQSSARPTIVTTTNNNVNGTLMPANNSFVYHVPMAHSGQVRAGQSVVAPAADRRGRMSCGACLVCFMVAGMIELIFFLLLSA